PIGSDTPRREVRSCTGAGVPLIVMPRPRPVGLGLAHISNVQVTWDFRGSCHSTIGSQVALLARLGPWVSDLLSGNRHSTSNSDEVSRSDLEHPVFVVASSQVVQGVGQPVEA